MPLFYFDFDDGQGRGPVRDAVGTELADMDAARLEASRTMAELAADALPGRHETLLAIVVRDALGVNRLRVSLNFRVENTG